MARYRIEFSRDWIRGRWGFIDRMFNKLGGKETEPSRIENAWLVEFKGRPSELGKYLTETLELKARDLKQFGAIFEITRVSPPESPPPPRRGGRRRPESTDRELVRVIDEQPPRHSPDRGRPAAEPTEE